MVQGRVRLPPGFRGTANIVWLKAVRDFFPGFRGTASVFATICKRSAEWRALAQCNDAQLGIRFNWLPR